MTATVELAWSWRPSADELPAAVLVVPDSTPDKPHLADTDNPDDLPLDAQVSVLEWSDWELSPVIHCIPQSACEQCGHRERQWISRGLVVPQEGATFSVYQVRRTKSGREYEKRMDVPAWRIYRLHAFLCVFCRHLDVYWTGPDGASWLPVSPTPPSEGVLW